MRVSVFNSSSTYFLPKSVQVKILPLPTKIILILALVYLLIGLVASSFWGVGVEGCQILLHNLII